MHLTHSSLQIEDRNTHDNHSDEIRHEKNSATVLIDKKGKAPKRAVADSESNDAEDVLIETVEDMGIVIVISNCALL
jgi:rRNA-processing protein FCF1